MDTKFWLFLLPIFASCFHASFFPVSPCHQQINNPLAGRVHGVIDTSGTLVRHMLYARSTAFAPELTLEFCLPLVVPLVDAFYWTPVNY